MRSQLKLTATIFHSVRCCFHAYTDNCLLETSNGYGTLGKQANDLNGTSEWKSRAGSTTTINSVGRRMLNDRTNEAIGSDVYTLKNGEYNNMFLRHYELHKYLISNEFSAYASSADIDVVDEGGSIYNGDENHQVWLGSQERLNDVAAESPYDFYSANGISNGKASTLGRSARARQISAPIPVAPPPESKTDKKQNKSKQEKQSSSQSLSGTLRPKFGHTNGGTLARHPHNGIPMHHHQMPMHQNMGPYGPLSMQPLPPSRPHLHMIPMQMPMMMPQQYATLQPSKHSKSKKKKDKMAIPLGMPVPPPMFAYPPSMIHAEQNRPLSMSNRQLAKSAATGLDNSGAESGTGIYRRKGHLNERAFSHSIRQENRSRSHGSL